MAGQLEHLLRLHFVICLCQHDEDSDCGGLEITGGKGRFLMFPQATSKIEENNDKFSPCSLRHTSRILKIKKDRCFVGMTPI